MPLRSLRIFQALPPYHGGKRRLLGEIFRHLPPPAEAPVLADCFLGGGSVSLYAKARGYRVLCNDIAERSYIVGRALIENDHLTMTHEDVLRLLVPQGDSAGLMEQHFCPDVVTTKHARFLDNALAAASKTEGDKRWLLLLLLVKYLFRLRPMGNFGAKTVVHQMEEGRWDEMNPAFLRDALARKVHGHPADNAEVLRRQINAGVFSNSRANRAYQLDVFDFLPQVGADIAYFDSPYAGTLAYERALKVVDDMLAGEVREHVQKSVFSGPEALAALERMLDAAQHIPVWAISYGNARTGIDDLVRLAGRFKSHVVAREIRYVHCTGLASEQARERNREFVVVARS